MKIQTIEVCVLVVVEQMNVQLSIYQSMRNGRDVLNMFFICGDDVVLLRKPF